MSRCKVFLSIAVSSLVILGLPRPIDPQEATTTQDALPNVHLMDLTRRPQRVGDCAETRIEYIGKRLSGSGGTRNVICFVSGLQLGYNSDPALDQSREGDLVRVCLVSIPAGCSEYNPGRASYRTTNLRTGRHWTLEDTDDDTLPCGSERVGELPKEEGECVETKIFWIGTRTRTLTRSTGSAVTFENGGFQVDYDTVPAIAESRKGDPVRMCLVEIPKNCPKGDDRGRVYSTTNLRTGKTWTLMDSQHACGGA
jgi:hypothetical protein